MSRVIQIEEEELILRQLLGPFGLGRARRRVAVSGSLPSGTELMRLDFALNGRPFLHVAARVNISTKQLDYADDAVPFLGVS